MLLAHNYPVRDREFRMFTQDLEIINDVRLLSLRARQLYEGMANRSADQQARNVLKRLARHRMEIVKAITSESAEARHREQLSEYVPETIRNGFHSEIEAVDVDLDTASLATFITKERREITFLRKEVKKIKNYTLRCRLSAVVATLQMDFDQLQALVPNPKPALKGDRNGKF